MHFSMSHYLFCHSREYLTHALSIFCYFARNRTENVSRNRRVKTYSSTEHSQLPLSKSL